ncbi:hypothetical protein MNBD_GAMMA11-103 [hydrothermal vent metagenome]|uniref:Uncharacterized protein n=1 Tax=hydrothermal vent metagenome TaxID=652676 RepID=A0A3B0X8N5_9ZZZZ
MQAKYRTVPGTLLLSLLTYGSIHTPLVAEERPSQAFLEYLGSEESRVDDKWSSPVDMDIERYLAENTQTTAAPAEKPSLNREDNAHE